MSTQPQIETLRAAIQAARRAERGDVLIAVCAGMDIEDIAQTVAGLIDELAAAKRSRRYDRITLQGLMENARGVADGLCALHEDMGDD